MKIALACDHAGFDHKEKTKEYLESLNYNIADFGCYSEESVDYPDYAHQLANSIKKNDSNLGIQFCGTGNGINMSANKHQEVRAALCWNTHIAEQARLHNNANVLSLGARFMSDQEMYKIIELWLSTDFESGRHKKRIEKLDED